MVTHMLFTKLMDALLSSYINLGTKMPKNDATITRKKTTQLLSTEEHRDKPTDYYNRTGHNYYQMFLGLSQILAVRGLIIGYNLKSIL